MGISLRAVFASVARGNAVPSTVIREANYLPDAKELRITFVSGRVYAYSDVPQTIHDAYRAAPSKGSFFNIAIRGRYRFRELIPPASSQDRKRSAR